MSNHEHPNALLILQCWQAAAHGDSETLCQLWDKNIVWHATANSPWKGDHVGQNAVLDYLARVGEIGDLYELTLQSVLANDDCGVVAFHLNSEIDERKLSVDQILFGRFKNRRITEIWTLPLDSEPINAFWNIEGS